MENKTLNAFVEGMRAAWGLPTSHRIAACCRNLTVLLRAPPDEAWLGALHRAGPASVEQHRDAAHGFLLLAHTEQAGLYRAPHDHGRNWVVYGVQRGEVEMGTYARIEGPDGTARLAEKSRSLLRAGEVRAYLRGDIHDTCCRSPNALLFRFTERDLKADDLPGHPITLYARPEGALIPQAGR